jgi:hypothetical protein
MGTETAGKTGQRERGDHRLGRDRTDPNDQPQPHANPENLLAKGKAKAQGAKPANAVTTGFGAESTGVEVGLGSEPLRWLSNSRALLRPRSTACSDSTLDRT